MGDLQYVDSLTNSIQYFPTAVGHQAEISSFSILIRKSIYYRRRVGAVYNVVLYM
jgi:hypothetical protein